MRLILDRNTITCKKSFMIISRISKNNIDHDQNKKEKKNKQRSTKHYTEKNVLRTQVFGRE